MYTTTRWQLYAQLCLSGNSVICYHCNHACSPVSTEYFSGNCAQLCTTMHNYAQLCTTTCYFSGNNMHNYALLCTHMVHLHCHAFSHCSLTPPSLIHLSWGCSFQINISNVPESWSQMSQSPGVAPPRSFTPGASLTLSRACPRYRTPTSKHSNSASTGLQALQHTIWGTPC
jgi:hypothetical protein